MFLILVVYSSMQKLQASVEQRADDEDKAVKRNKALLNKNRAGADIPGTFWFVCFFWSLR